MSECCLFNLPCVKNEADKTELQKIILSFAESLDMNIAFGDPKNDDLCRSGKMNLCFYVYNSPSKDVGSVETSFISDYEGVDAYPRFCEHFSFLYDFAHMLFDSGQKRVELFLGNAGETDIREFEKHLSVTDDHLLKRLFDITAKDFFQTLKTNNIFNIIMPSVRISIKKNKKNINTDMKYWSFSQNTECIHKISIVDFAYEDSDSFSVIKTLEADAAKEAVKRLQEIGFKPAYWGSHFGLGFLVEYKNGEFDVITYYSPHRYKRIAQDKWKDIPLPWACDQYGFYRLIEKILFMGTSDSISVRTCSELDVDYEASCET